MVDNTINNDKTIADGIGTSLPDAIAFSGNWARAEWVRFGWRKIGH